MRALIFLGSSILGIGLPYSADAQVSAQGAQVLRCESRDGRHKLCPVDMDDGVTLIRQLSRSVCVRNQTWGTERRGVWVAQGCRAEFRIGGRAVDDEDDNRRAHVVRCESQRGALNECRADVRGGVRVLRQLSSSPCAAGRSWGHGRGVIWVSDGCRADFMIGPSSGDPLEDHGSERVIRCESKDGRPQRCDVSIARGAQMVRQLSRSTCIQNRNWGWDRQGVWVSGGCRAEFSVW